MANEMIEKPKLNFFQRIRKSFLMRRITLKKYNKAPDYLRQDDDVIQELIYSNPSNISVFSLEEQISFAEKYPGFLEGLPNNTRANLLENKPELITKLDSAIAEEFILRRLNKSSLKDEDLAFIKFMPEEFQVRLLTEKVEYGDYKKTYSGKYERESVEPNKFVRCLEFFSPDAVEKAVIMLVESAKKVDNKYDWKQKKARVPLLSDMEIDKLPVETQLKITLLDSDFMDKMSDEALEKYVGDNILLVKKLSPKKMLGYIKNNPEMFSALSWDEKQKLLSSDYELQKIIPTRDRLRMNYFCHSFRSITDVEDVKKYLIESENKSYSDIADTTDTVRDKDTLIEVARFEPLVLNTYGGGDMFKIARKVGHVVDLFKYSVGPYGNSKILSAIDRIPDKHRYDNDHESKNLLLPNVAKVLFNKKVMASVSPEVIARYVSNPNMGDLREILVKTYGEHVNKILDERPNLKLSHIPVLDIFDKGIYDKFGEVTIHNMLSYESNGVLVLGELARNPEKMKMFDMFSEIIGDYFENTATDFNKKLVMYKKLEKVLENTRIEEFTEERKETIKQVITDSYMTHSLGETDIIPLDSMDDLDNYMARRNKMYDDFMMKSNSPDEIKDMISKRFFGLEYGNGVSDRFEQNVLSLQSMIYYYNLESFVNDERTQESGMFSQDELDMMELATIIDKIDDIDVLREIYRSLEGRDDVIRPTDFVSVKNKIPMQYSSELVNSLLTVENARERAENGEQGISFEQTEDGYEIVKLSGADFKILMHTTGINNSGLDLPRNENQEEIFKTFEDGCSTISASLIEPEMLKACTVPGRINLGFAKVPPKQILGMSHRDAHVTHNRRVLNPHFDYGAVRFNYPDEIMRKTAAQITGQEAKDQSHEYNEVAMYRRMIENDKYEEGTFGGRVMPDYIVVYGKADGSHKEAAKRLGKNGKPLPIVEIDTEKYFDRTYMRGHSSRKEEHSKDRNKGQVVQDVLKITNKEEQEGR